MNQPELTDKELAVLAAKFPLPDSVPDTVMNKDALARAFNTNVNTIDKWLSAGMPVLNRGKNGQAYELQLSHCWAWKQNRDAESEQRTAAMDAAARAMRLELTGGQIGDSVDALTPRQKTEVMQTQMTYEAFQRARNELIDRKDVVELLESIFTLTRDVLNALPDRLERDADLEARAVERTIEICDATMKTAKNRIEEFFEARPVSTTRERADLFDA